MNPTSIDQVIEKLESIIRWSEENSSRVGFFASLYLRVTRTIKSKIGEGYFDDDERLEKLDVIFANRYFAAYEQFRNNDPALPKAWAVAFDAVSNDGLIIVQHLLLGISAHINIDLGVASAQTAPGAEIDDLEGDFQKVNDVLATLVPASLAEISELSPLLHLLEDVAGQKEEEIINFSIKVARKFSWNLALQLAPLTASDQEEIIDQKNTTVAKLGDKVVNPGFVTASILKKIHAVEVKNVNQIIDTLNAGNELDELIEKGEETILTPEELKTSPNHIYYFQKTEGFWTGTLDFKIKSWRKMFGSSIGMKNKILLSKLRLFQIIFGKPSINSTITTFPTEGKAGIARIDSKIFKGWLKLAVCNEEHIVSPDGKTVAVDAKISFGILPLFLNEHDVYPGSVYESGSKALYHMDLLGSTFIGNFSVDGNNRKIEVNIENEWAKADEILNK